jgi:hypothetical protein
MFRRLLTKSINPASASADNAELSLTTITVARPAGIQASPSRSTHRPCSNSTAGWRRLIFRLNNQLPYTPGHFSL